MTRSKDPRFLGRPKSIDELVRRIETALLHDKTYIGRNHRLSEDADGNLVAEKRVGNEWKRFKLKLEE